VLFYGPCIRLSVNVPQNHAPIQSKMADGGQIGNDSIAITQPRVADCAEIRCDGALRVGGD